MSKMGSHDPFGHLKHKLWPKERPRIKLAIWFLTTKSQESLQFPCVQVACNILLKSFGRGLQLCFRAHLNRKFAHKVMGPQNRGSPNFGNFGSPRTKWHLGVGPVAKHKVYYKGEDGGFLQVRAMVSLVSLWLPVARPCTKVLELRTN
jgi:hypothetical protein